MFTKYMLYYKKKSESNFYFSSKNDPFGYKLRLEVYESMGYYFILTKIFCLLKF